MPADAFDQLPLFQGLTAAQLDLLRPLFVPFDCYAGTVLFEQGQPADYLYIVVTGEVVIQYTPEDGEAIPVTRVREGGVVGWSAAVGRRNYTSAAVCAQYAQMMRLRGADLQSLRKQHPETGRIFLDRLADNVARRVPCTRPQVVSLLENGLSDSVHQAGG